MGATSFEPKGVIPACLMPFNEDLSINEAAYRAHLEDIASVKGLGGITINGHAAEVHALTIEEQKRAIVVTKDTIQSRLPTIVGICTESSIEAGRLAAYSQNEGAEGLLVFPPAFMSMGGHLRPEMIYEHLGHITNASDLPIILFQFPVASQLSYPVDTLLELCRRFPTIRAVKDQIGDGNQHERQVRELHALDKPVYTLTTHSSWLLGSLVMGCDGLLSGAGSVIADLQLGLFNAVQAGDLNAARAINDRIYPTVRAFYDAPLLDMHNRMKEALVLLGRMKEAYVRPPLVKPSAAEIQKIGRMLELAGLTSDSVYQYAA
jgi:4-hydroxy-tetrahydrodipicolinate synthase